MSESNIEKRAGERKSVILKAIDRLIMDPSSSSAMKIRLPYIKKMIAEGCLPCAGCEHFDFSNPAIQDQIFNCKFYNADQMLFMTHCEHAIVKDEGDEDLDILGEL